MMSFSMAAGTAQALSPQEELGKSIFFDKKLSLKKNQSCASCHDPRAGWAGANPGINKKGAVYPGSIRSEFGARKPPTSAYATPAPILDYVVEDGDALFIGGNFWDGRATGEKLGNPAADQAQGPFLNPVEQALPDPACVVYRVCNANTPSQYPVAFGDVYPGACDINWPARVDRSCKSGDMINLDPIDRDKVDEAYDNIGLSVAAYEASAEVNQYTSKYDAYLIGQAELTAEEQLGLSVFAVKGQCAACHVLDPQQNGEPPLLTDYTFDNLGVPKNPENPVYDNDPDFVDEGLGGFLETQPEYAAFADANKGKHKVPTLRNVDQRPGNGFTKAYAHNGYFKTLEGIVNFYNTRDVKPACPDPMTTEADALAQGCWPAPEVVENVNTDELGDLELTPAEEAALVAFMKTLSDGYFER
jgi:cytochrome c peroxidase